MEAIALILTKFSEELIALQLALLFSSLSVAVYWMLVRKKKRESAEWVPAALVRAYLDRARAEEREVRARLFGDEGSLPAPQQAPLAAALGTASADPALMREIEALRAQLSAADQKFIESDRSMSGLRAEKAALEQKLLDAQKAKPVAGAATGASDPALQKELEELRARLQEYEVIEDDLANLKKFQKENEQLRQKLEELGQGGATAPAAEPAAPAPQPAIALVKEEPAPVVEAAAPAPAEEPAPVVAEAAVAEAAPAAPAAGEEAAPAEKSAKQKEDELLSEFEKMLAS